MCDNAPCILFKEKHLKQLASEIEWCSGVEK